jgi:chromosome segregation ATPase
VTTITFANNDKDESAANALACVMASQKKHGDGYTRGTRPEKLYKKAHDKMEEAHKQELLGAKEFDEKTSAAIKFSLEAHAVKLEAIEDGVQAHAVKLEAIGDGVHSQAVDLVDIKQGVCNVIPDYQVEIKQLKEALAHKTKLCDRIEGQKGRLTMEINRLKWELSERMDENEALNGEKRATGKKIQDLQMQLDLCQSIALLKQMQEEAQRTAEILSSTLAEERAAKRPRA